MNDYQPPSPDSRIDLEIKGVPIRLWWKLMEEAQRKKIGLSYLVFQALVEKVGFDPGEESYDLVVQELRQAMEESK